MEGLWLGAAWNRKMKRRKFILVSPVSKKSELKLHGPGKLLKHNLKEVTT